MNSAPSRINSAAIETSDEIRKSAQWTALRAMIVKSPATSAATANTQKKSASQPERIISFRFQVSSFRFQVPGLKLETWNLKLETYDSYLTVSRPCSSISRFQTKPARE